MKKYFYIALCVLLVLVAGYLVLSVLISDDMGESVPIAVRQPLPDPRPGDSANPHFTAYKLSYERFYQFVEAPSLEILNQMESGERAFVYSLSKTTETAIMRKELDGNPIDAEEDNLFRIGNIIVDESLVKFSGDRVKLQTFLGQHGVIGEIEYVAVLQVPAVPIVIWTQVGNQSFFITIEAVFEDITNHTGALSYQFYTQSDFYELIRQGAGTLIVNGIYITGESHIVFHYGHVELPLVAVLEALGADVQWLEDEIILIAYADKEYKLDINRRSLVEVETDQLHSLLVTGGGVVRFEVLDGELIVTNWSIWAVLQALGAEIHIDRAQMVVTISS